MSTPAPVTQVRLVATPRGAVGADTWRVTHDPLPALAAGQVHVRLSHVSVDPGMRGWITPKRSYIPPVQPGETMRAFGIGEVVASEAPGVARGDWVTGFTGVATEAVLPARGLRKVDVSLAPPVAHLSGLGMTGFTAYFGLFDVGRPEPGETVVVSSAAGAVGSVASQLAKSHGCRVVGIAGGAEKRRTLLDELGLDAAIDYRSENVAEALCAAAPQGVDLYFDNVGGETLDVVLMQIRRHARIVVCGGVSQYGDMDAVRGPANYLQLTAQSARMQGFTMLDYLARIPEAFAQLHAAWRAGRLRFREHVLRGIESFPRAFEMLLAGENHGKLLIALEETE